MARGFSSYLSSRETLQGSDEEPFKYSSVEEDLKVSLCTLISCENKVKLVLGNTLRLGISARIYSLAQLIVWLASCSES